MSRTVEHTQMAKGNALRWSFMRLSNVAASGQGSEPVNYQPLTIKPDMTGANFQEGWME